MKVEDLRKSARKEIKDLAYIICSDGAVKGEIADISLSGVRFILDVQIPGKFVIEININYKPVNFLQKAHIIWTKRNEQGKYEYGAEFINVRREHMVLLEDYINSFRS